MHCTDEDGRFEIHYDDGDTKFLQMTEDHCKIVAMLPATAGEAFCDLEVTSMEGSALCSMLEHFGRKPFLIQQAQGFDQFALVNAHKAEKEAYFKAVRPVPKSEISPSSNTSNSHALYKIERIDDGSLKLKARIAPHWNKNDLKEFSSKDCTTCLPTGLGVSESPASLFGWTLYKADIKAAFLQTGTAQRDVYVRPQRESDIKGAHLWGVLTVSYVPVDANAKCQSQSDPPMYDKELTQSTHVPLLLFQKENGTLVLIAVEIVDDLKTAGESNRTMNFSERFDKKFKPGHVSHGSGKLRQFGINSTQNGDFTVETDADERLDRVKEDSLSRQR